MRREMATLLEHLARKRAMPVVVITGGDEIFCAGAEIGEMGGCANAEG